MIGYPVMECPVPVSRQVSLNDRFAGASRILLCSGHGDLFEQANLTDKAFSDIAGDTSAHQCSLSQLQTGLDSLQHHGAGTGFMKGPCMGVVSGTGHDDQFRI